MKKKLPTLVLLLLALCALPSTAVAQRIAAYFVISPNDLLPTLTANRRRDMVDFARVDKFNYVENELGGVSRLTHLSENRITVELSTASKVQMQLLHTTDSTTLIAVVNTLCAPACTSTLTLYDLNWYPQPLEHYIELPTTEQFVTDSIAANYVDVMLASYSFINDTTFAISPQLEEYLPTEIYEEITPSLITKPLTYRWNGEKFIAISE